MVDKAKYEAEQTSFKQKGAGVCNVRDIDHYRGSIGSSDDRLYLSGGQRAAQPGA